MKIFKSPGKYKPDKRTDTEHNVFESEQVSSGKSGQYRLVCRYDKNNYLIHW